MKKNYCLLLTIVLLHPAVPALAQCGSPVPLGSASNMFTIIRNGNNPVAAEKSLNMIAFVHRNNASLFGGNSGHLRYDVSTSGGTTWALDQGVLNPANTHLARYPNMAIYNSTTNTNPANSFVSYMAATINSATSAWNGLVSGVEQLGGTGLTENYNQPVQIPQLIPHSLVKGAPGIFWAIDPLYNGAYNGFAIYKGTWNSSISDITWVTNFTVAPTWNTFSGQDYNIAFDPTGQYGWFCINGHISGGPSTSAYYPTLWRTVNGGTTWTGPYTADLSKMSCFSSFVTGSNAPSANLEHDLVVDVNGNPHIFTTIMNSTSYALYYNQAHWMYDITMVDSLWAAYPVASVAAGMASWGTGGDVAQMYLAPQAARSADGTKVFFTWADNTSYSMGAPNISPNLFTRAFDVSQKMWTQTKDVTSCNTSMAGKVIFPHLAPEALEPASGVYKLAPVYAEFTSGTDPLQPVNFHFINNVTFSTSEFSVAVPDASVSIAQGSSLLLCPGSSVQVSVPGAGQAYWNTGATTTTLAVSSATASPLIVTAQKNCLVGSDTIVVTNLTVSATSPSLGACPGGTIPVTATGNASSYTWSPGAITGSSAVLVAGSTPFFTLHAQGDGCVVQQTVAFNLLAEPTVAILGPDTACSSNPITYTATGAATYTWHNGSTANIFTVAPSMNSTYSVTGTAANSCTNSQVINVLVIPSPTMVTSQTSTAVCVGSSATLVVLGAQTHSWSTGDLNNSIAVTPDSTSTYTVTGFAANGCTDLHEFTVHVNALPSLSVTTTRTLMCKGEKAVLHAFGANTYTWLSPASTNFSVTISPTTTTNYILKGKDKNSCINTFTFTQSVDACAGLPEQSSHATLLVFPNPATGMFTIRNPGKAQVLILNQLGQVVRNLSPAQFSDSEAEVRDLAAGMYFVSDGARCIKIIVNE